MDDELASELLSIHPPYVQTATSTYHKFQTYHWQNYVETNDVVDIFTIMLSQMVRAFCVAKEAEALFKNT